MTGLLCRCSSAIGKEPPRPKTCRPKIQRRRRAHFLHCVSCDTPQNAYDLLSALRRLSQVRPRTHLTRRRLLLRTLPASAPAGALQEERLDRAGNVPPNGSHLPAQQAKHHHRRRTTIQQRWYTWWKLVRCGIRTCCNWKRWKRTLRWFCIGPQLPEAGACKTDEHTGKFST